MVVWLRTAVLDVGGQQTTYQKPACDFARVGVSYPLAVSEVIMQKWLIEWYDPTAGCNQSAVIRAWTWWMAVEKFKKSLTKAYPPVVPIVGIRPI